MVIYEIKRSEMSIVQYRMRVQVFTLILSLLCAWCSGLPSQPYPEHPPTDDPIPPPIGDDGVPEPPMDEVDRHIYGIRIQSVGLPDFNVGERVKLWRPGRGAHPEELGSYHQGDILEPPKFARNGIINTYYRWPGGVIPYRISGSFTSAQLNMVSMAMAEYHKYTCIRFVPYTNQRDYVSIESANTGCWSNLGRIGGPQKVNLQLPGCTYYIGTVIHELLHTVGFYHEQSRVERDNYVNILLQNVMAGQAHNFNKYNSTAFGVPYDYGSVMHYSGTAFSSNNQPTIVPKQSGAVIGQRRGFSPADIEKIRLMYKCNGFQSGI